MQRFVGDIWDDDTCARRWPAAMTCTTAWSTPAAGCATRAAVHTNVEGTRNVLDVALDVQKSGALQRNHLHQQLRHRRPPAGPYDQRSRHHLRPRADALYVRSRVQAEELVLRYARERNLPAIAMCVSTTYGSGDWGRTPHGAIIAGAAFGKLPFVMAGIRPEAVGIDDAARAMILAAEHGRSVSATSSRRR